MTLASEFSNGDAFVLGFCIFVVFFFTRWLFKK